jgi:hypothetical protein
MMKQIRQGTNYRYVQNNDADDRNIDYIRFESSFCFPCCGVCQWLTLPAHTHATTMIPRGAYTYRYAHTEAYYQVPVLARYILQCVHCKETQALSRPAVQVAVIFLNLKI